MIMPYISFDGNCEEVLTFYAKAFGGQIQHMVKYGAMPENLDFPLSDEQKNKVMHAQISLTEAGGIGGADAMWDFEKGSAISIHAHFENEKRAMEVFNALAEGGIIISPIVSNPPPDNESVSGMLKDKFGFGWIISAMKEQQ